MSGFDDLDELLGGDDELEAAFRELDAQLQMDAMRRGGSSASKSRRGASPRQAQRAGARAQSANDPLADLKSALDGAARPGSTRGRSGATPANEETTRASAARYLLVVCPRCSGKNRVPLKRLRESLPICGRCKTDLSVERS